MRLIFKKKILYCNHSQSMWLGLGSTQFPQKLDFSIKRVHFEAHIYRNSKEERILRLIYKKSYYKIKEEHILRLIYSKIKEEQI